MNEYDRQKIAEVQAARLLYAWHESDQDAVRQLFEEIGQDRETWEWLCFQLAAWHYAEILLRFGTGVTEVGEDRDAAENYVANEREYFTETAPDEHLGFCLRLTEELGEGDHHKFFFRILAEAEDVDFLRSVAVALVNLVVAQGVEDGRLRQKNRVLQNLYALTGENQS